MSPRLLKRMHASANASLRDTAYETVQSYSVEMTRREAETGRLRGTNLYMPEGKGRCVYDMDNRESGLPGKLAREESDALTNHADVDLAFEHSGTVHQFYEEVFGRRSLDDRRFALISSVRYGVSVANSFWYGRQIVLGGGDGTYFLSSAKALDVIAHEFAHGVVEFTSNLDYFGEAGALQESFCDVMGALTMQWKAGHAAAQADWLLGSALVGPALSVPALRSFRADPIFKGHPDLGDDDQPKHMSRFLMTQEDNGGVHDNAGIPNHAFYQAATMAGGNAWEGVGRVWFNTFTKLVSSASFQDAANATRAEARVLFGAESVEEKAVAGGWAAVGIMTQEVP